MNQKLLQSWELLKNVIDSFPGLFVWKYVNSVLMGYSNIFVKQFVFKSPVEIIGKRDSDLSFMPEEVERFLEDDRAVMDSCKPNLHFEEREHAAGGEEIVLDTCKFLLFEGKDQVVGLLAVAVDISILTNANSLHRNIEIDRTRCLVNGYNSHTVKRLHGEGS